MRDIDEGRADLAVDRAELGLEFLAQGLVERAQRLVEQQQFRREDERAGKRDALLLPARQLAGIAMGEGLEFGHLQRGHDLRPGGVAGDAARPQGEGDVVVDGEMREQRIALEDHAEIAPLRRQPGHVAAVEQHAPAAGRDEAGDAHQDRRLARAGRAEQRDELAGLDRQIGRFERDEIAIALTNLVEDKRVFHRCGPIPHAFQAWVHGPVFAAYVKNEMS